MLPEPGLKPRVGAGNTEGNGSGSETTEESNSGQNKLKVAELLAHWPTVVRSLTERALAVLWQVEQDATEGAAGCGAQKVSTARAIPALAFTTAGITTAINAALISARSNKPLYT